VQKKLRAQQAQLRKNKENVKKGLHNLMLISSDIETQRRSIDSINADIKTIEQNIKLLNGQLLTLNQQLTEKREGYIRAVRHMNRRNTFQDRVMFIFSAESFTQMYRRMRFMKDYAAYQKLQGEQLKQKQLEIQQKQKQLEEALDEKSRLLSKGQKAQEQLKLKQDDQQKVVKQLQKQQKTIQSVIDEQKKKDDALNAQIEAEIAKEVERARLRAEAEAKKRAAEEEARRKKAAEELARKKAEAQRRAEENARRIAEAKEAERKAKAEAEAKRNTAERERAEQKAREAEAARVAAERKAEAEQRRSEKEVAQAKKETEMRPAVAVDDLKMSGSFEKNRGRLPMPITGSYRIVSHYGQYSVNGLPNVQLDNKGINILGTAGCSARAIFDGEVSGVFGYAGEMVVMVRHGLYISVYCNLKDVSVKRGQKVSTGQRLGTVGNNNILQFQLRRHSAKLNPEQWLGR
jgi:septal ring factor EnvC (AmiA/AmiB activator)